MLPHFLEARMFEYYISAGPGTLLSYGIVNQFTFVDQRTYVDFWGVDENDRQYRVKCPTTLSFEVRKIPVGTRCETGL